jgi:flagellar hook-associated protein 1 FlgK
MQSTFTGIEIGKRSIIAHNQAISTTGHNLSNAATEGYSRQRVEFSAFDPIYMPGLNREETPGQLGQGVVVDRISRIKDEILEGRIAARVNVQGYWEAKDNYTRMLEQVYNEPGDLSVRSRMDKFWEAWQELSLHPSESAARKTVLQRGESLVDSIQNRYRNLREVRDMLDTDIRAAVVQINSITKDITSLNEQIVKVKAMGDNPNDLMDKRDLLVMKLADYIDVTVDNRDPDEFTIHTGGRIIVQGRQQHQFSTAADPLNEGYSNVVWADNQEEAQFRGGRVLGLLEMRDNETRVEIQKLDSFAVNFMDLVNDIHRSAWSANGRTGMDFFTEYPFVNNVQGNYDRNGDGAFDSTYIFRITGTNTLEPKEQLGFEGTMTLAGKNGNVQVRYYAADTVEAVVKRINTSGAEVVANLDRNNRLTLRGTASENRENPDFVIRHAEDSGEFLTNYAGLIQAQGAEGAFRWTEADAVINLRGGELVYSVAPLTHPSGWMGINPAVKSDTDNIAGGFGVNGKAANEGDGSAALQIASLRNSNIMIGQIKSFDDYFSETVADIGLKGERAGQALETERAILKELGAMRDSISGVNIDEELTQLIKFQHGYTAAARFITEIDKMLDVIINRMGV